MGDIKALLEKIIADAGEKADAIIARAEQQAEMILDQAQREAGVIWDEMKLRAADAAEEERKRILSEAALQSRKQILQAKRELIEKAFANASETIKNMDDSRYEKFLGDLAVSLVSGEGARIFIAYNDRSRLRETFIEDIGARLLESKGFSLTEYTDREFDINNGFILTQGKYLINASLKSLSETYRELLEPDVIRIFFRNTREGDKSETAE